MKHLYLHIGLGKTGSSALQSWLSLNAKRICDQGFDYADLAPDAKSGAISSGNGDELLAACRGNDWAEVQRLLNEVYFFTGKNDKAIVSCELFQGMTEGRIQYLRELCDENGIQVTIIAFVRSIYEKAYSAYLQGLKRGGNDHLFGDKPSEINSSSNIDFIKRYYIQFGERVQVLNYDHVKDDVYKAFADLVGFSIEKFKVIDKKINRSVTREEADVLRAMNGLHGGEFSTQISDHMISRLPDLKTEAHYIPEIVEKVREKSAGNINWINRQFKLDPPLECDFYTGDSEAQPIVINAASYEPVVDWALSFKPSKQQHGHFFDFLQKFAEFLETNGYGNEKKVLSRAKKLGPGKHRVEVEEKPENLETVAGTESAEDSDSPGRMESYLLTFYGARPGGATVEEFQQGYKDLFGWLQSVDDETLQPYAQLDDTIELANDGTMGTTPNVETQSVMLVTAASREEALSIAQSSPALRMSERATVSLLKNPVRALLTAKEQ